MKALIVMPLLLLLAACDSSTHSYTTGVGGNISTDGSSATSTVPETPAPAVATAPSDGLINGCSVESERAGKCSRTGE